MTSAAATGFTHRAGALYCEGVPLAEIAARFGTPSYVYSRRAIEAAFAAYADALAGRDALVCYAIKANSNLAVLNVLARLGAGFDIVSGGELARVLAAGGDARKTVFSGVGKTSAEIAQALAAEILCFNVESAAELAEIERVAAQMDKRAPISLRVNPDVDPKTHPYISTGLRENKFGVAYEDALPLYRRAAASKHLRAVGIDCHIGSQITEVAPYVDAADRLLDLVDALARAGIRLHHIDFGGGLGIRYRDESPPPPGALIGALVERVTVRGHADKALLFEPGRSLVGAAGVLLTRVTLLKPGAARNFAVVDAAMNDLLRPSLYEAWMDVQPVQARAATPTVYDIVGPVCESGDWLARDRELALAPGDLLAVRGAGAYGMSMASNYNSRGRAAEVMVDGERFYCVRRREEVAELFAGESVLP
ncbi:MAG TPA: diaminopimelate decarboxylase [Burkholderiaceae bacterium]|nr:diaminopimelate decarboxylase [Burkholderiaceae bacterium]